MNDFTYDNINQPTSIPCPSWCSIGAGHAFDTVDDGEPIALYRSHAHELGSLSEPAVAGTRQTPTVSVAVSIQSLEQLRTTPDGVLVREVDPPHIVLDANDNGMSSSQARRVAGMLLEAADVWDQVAGGAR